MRHKIEHFLTIIVVMIALASCSGEEGAPGMLWEVTATPEKNVHVEAFPDYHPQIQIVTNREESEVTLTCVNYKSLKLHYQNNTTTEIIRDPELCFTAKVVDENKIQITFEKLPETFDVSTDTFIKIDGSNGKDFNMTAAKISRFP